MRKAVITVIFVSLLQGCSDSSSTSNNSKAYCDSLGGELVNGQCEIVDPDQIKSLCEREGLTYSEKYNACLQ